MSYGSYKTNVRRPIDPPILGSGLLPCGVHDVILSDVMCTETKVLLTFTDAAGNNHKEWLFKRSPDNQQLGYKLRRVLSLMLRDIWSLSIFVDFATTDDVLDDLLKALKRVKVELVIAPDDTGDYTIEKEGMWFVAINPRTGESLTEQFNSASALRKACDDAGLKRAYPQIDSIRGGKYESTNLQSIYTAIEAVLRAQGYEINLN